MRCARQNEFSYLAVLCRFAVLVVENSGTSPITEEVLPRFWVLEQDSVRLYQLFRAEDRLLAR
jgi:hypothetical protein